MLPGKTASKYEQTFPHYKNFNYLEKMKNALKVKFKVKCHQNLTAFGVQCNTSDVSYGSVIRRFLNTWTHTRSEAG